MINLTDSGSRVDPTSEKIRDDEAFPELPGNAPSVPQRSKRSTSITLVHAATKSSTNFSLASSLA